MKLTIILLTAFGLQAAASTGFAQRITLHMKDASLVKVIEEIGNQSGYDFLYGTALEDHHEPVSLQLNAVELKDALQQVLASRNLDYTIKNKTVIVFQKKANMLDRLKAYWNETVVTGRVMDESGGALPGVTVQVKGTSVVAQTDAKGYYRLTAPREDVTLVFSFVGFETQEINTVGRTEINVVLRLAHTELEDAVVVAYGTQKRKDLTGSVATVSQEALQDLPSTISLEQALQGQVPGVVVLQETGQPGGATRVRIRGASSLLGSNQPLYVVDGVPVIAEGNIPDDGSLFNNDLLKEGLSSPLNNINPDDIESITILKDASATAIYGSRAANGVILITTKHGKKGMKPVYSFNTSASLQEAVTQSVLNAQQFREIWTEAANNSTSTAAAVQAIRDGSYFGNADTDWEREVSPANPLTKNMNFSVRGSGDRVGYFASVGVNDQQGTFDNSNFKRYNFLINLDADIAPTIQVGTSINLSSSNQMSPDGGLLSRVYAFRPDLPVYDEDGNFTMSPGFNQENPVALSKANINNRTGLLIGSVYGEATIARDFRFRSVLSINYNRGDLKSFYPRYTVQGGWSRLNGPGGGFAAQSANTTLSHLWENTLSYQKNFNDKHELDGIAGISWQGNYSEYLKASGEGFPQDDILNNLSSATSDFLIASDKVQSGLASFFGRVNYQYDNRFIVSASARTDGSSKFASENKWAFFPTGAIAWRISQERFLQNADFIDELKIRASTGLTGQQSFSAYQWRSLFGSTQYGGQPAVIQNQLGNSRLKWERTLQTDIGLDFSFFNGRLTGTADYYERHTRDLLFSAKMPTSTGFAVAIGNLGNTLNKGFEIMLEGGIIRKEDFGWDIQVNATHNTNKLTSLNEDFLNANTKVINPPGSGGILRVGEPMGLIFGRVVEGIIQTTEELEALNAGAPDGIYQFAGTAPGDLKFKDLNGDGEFTAADQDIIGDANPDLTGGITNTFRYKGLRLSALFTYSLGNDLRWGTQANTINFYNTFSSENKMDFVMNRWTPERPTDQPRAVYGDPNGNASVSSYYVHDASYLRLKNLLLAYTVPAMWLERTGFIKSFDIHASATNLLTWTRYPGLNPEASNLFNDDLSTGLDISRSPIAKVFTIGIRANF